MKLAHDIFSETNPAFCTYALGRFVKAFQAVDPRGPEVPLAYISLPLALSGDLESSFERTNKNTGLLEWLDRTPRAQVDLIDRLNGSMTIVTDGIRFGCFLRVLEIDGARLRLGPGKLKQAATKALGDESLKVLTRAERLGYWLAAVGSTKAVFSMVGVTV